MSGTSTKIILDLFDQISQVPRCSKNEEKIRIWLLNWAKNNGLNARADKIGNVLVEVPASPGYEAYPGVVLQGHMDMVCEKTPQSKHDFSKDPISTYIDGDWLRAKNTTLGADNGIAMAIALAVALDKGIKRPNLELLFTVDEETGLTGAGNLEKNFLKGKYLINLDSEDEGIITIGCAGGLNINVDLPIKFEESSKDLGVYKLTVAGLSGGHSGVDVDKGRASAISLLVRVLKALKEELNGSLSYIYGGSAHNAIPRDAYAIFHVDKKHEAKAKQLVLAYQTLFNKESLKSDPELTITLDKSEERNTTLLTDTASSEVLNLLSALPHGIFSFSQTIDGLVETSSNLATVKLEESTLKVLMSLRSSLKSRLDELAGKVDAVALLAGAKSKHSGGYPSWEPVWDSRLLQKSKDIFRKCFNKDPHIDVIHAGLECGVIGSKHEGMEMLSIGPTIKNPHSPQECLKISDIDKIWTFLVRLLEDLH